MSGPYPDPASRALISGFSMAAGMMVLLDSTIVNVALPHIQANVAASPEQILWVFTSFLVATAIGMPVSGWLADRFGRKRVLLVSLAGFIVASAACGIATDLYSLVLFRFLQGLSGASVQPLNQATMLDIYPPERYGQAMAILGIGTVFAPVFGPTLGGWITDALNWRWIFFINVPIGIVTLLGISAFVPEARSANPSRFDFFGFSVLAIALTSFQLALDRGQQLDWFSSPEICIEAGMAVIFGYITVVHVCTAKHPFIHPAIFADRNFVVATLVASILGLLVYGVVTQVAPMLQNLFGYTAMHTGLVTAPRGAGSIISMLVAGQLMGRVPVRVLMTTGLAIAALSSIMLAHLSLETDEMPIVFAGLVQGLGVGLVFVPITALSFSTLSPLYRNEASALHSLMRSIGGAIGVSALQILVIRTAAGVQSRLVEDVRPDNPVLALRAPDFDFNAPDMVAGMIGQITRQAWMVAYNDIFWFLGVVSILLWPSLFLLHQAKQNAPAKPEPLPLD